MIFSALEVYDDRTPRSAAINMALDEVLWQSATVPQVRFYEWDHPALSFGYFIQYAEVAHYESERELVRRSTGGGIVLHGNDLTYALIIPAIALPDITTSTSVYTFVHSAIQQALHGVGISAALAESEHCRASVSDAIPSPPSHRDGLQSSAAERTVGYASNSCFANPVPADVLVSGRKVAGAAQRRARRGLLQQGSIQNISLPPDFRQRFVHALAVNNAARQLEPNLLQEAHQLADRKYAADSWLKRR